MVKSWMFKVSVLAAISILCALFDPAEEVTMWAYHNHTFAPNPLCFHGLSKTLVKIRLFAAIFCLLGIEFPSAIYAQRTTSHTPISVGLPRAIPVRIVPGLEEPLVATGDATRQEDKELDAAIVAFHSAAAKVTGTDDFSDYAKPFIDFIREHPNSSWNSALYTDLGFGYYRAGYFSRAFDAWQHAWQSGRTAKDPQASIMVDRAVGELARMHARVGHEKELQALLNDIGQRPISGSATETIQGAREGLWKFHHDPSLAYLCGPQALKNVLIALKASTQDIQLASDATSGPHGYSLRQLAALANKAHLKYTLIHREPGQPIPVPSIINWNVHHYAAVVAHKGGLYLIQDPTFGMSGVVSATQKAIDAETSGYFLVPEDAHVLTSENGWRDVRPDSTEAQAVYGMGWTTDNLDDVLCISCLLNSSVQISTPGDRGMTLVNAHTMDVSLHLSDTPVGYQPQKGPAAFTRVFYNQREMDQPATFSYSNIGQKWSLNWQAFIEDTIGGPDGLPILGVPGGGGGIQYQYYPEQFGTHAELWDNTQLFRITDATGKVTSYERRHPDGSKDVYANSDGATSGTRRMFLTRIVDAQGNSVTLHYDSKMRITSVVDATGRSTLFTYGLTGQTGQYLITKITDPFGRSATFSYENLMLHSITDAVGITSTFTYPDTDPSFVSQLSTPYGTSNFSHAYDLKDTAESNTRSLTMTDPLGYTDYLYYYPNYSIISSSDATDSVPTKMSPGATNDLLQYRNMFYWNKHAFALGVKTDTSGAVVSHDYSKAFLTHWGHWYFGTTFTGSMPESVKPPLENRIWFNYPRQSATYNNGYLNKASARARVLDDGTTQISRTAWNASGNANIGLVAGNMLSQTDAVGRTTQFNWAANNQDLLTVEQLTAPSTYTTIATFGEYNSQHEPTTYTDTAGQEWLYTYNAAGQLETITDPESHVTTYKYDTLGRLSSVENANEKTVLTLTYDSADRVHTRTDSEGYLLTYGYDNLDRVTSITYPDGTTDLYSYIFATGPNAGKESLDLRKHTDRLGRVTTYNYDADRHLISMTEPINGSTTRTTSYDYYEDGTLKDIKDANGNVTHWNIDIESRPISKTYAYGTSEATTETYTYEKTTSRLHSIQDAIGQVKTFTYGLDDHVTAVTYSGTKNPTPNVTFAYDPYFPRLTSMTDGTGKTEYSYTPIGDLGALKLASISGPFSNDSISLTYDALGRLAGRDIPGGNESFDYDAISRLTTHGTPLGTFDYSYLGQTSQTTLRKVTNGKVTVSTGWTYDTNINDRRLLNINNSGVSRSYVLRYLIPDGSGKKNPYDIMNIQDTAAAGHPFATQYHAYGYDSIDRLLTATAATPGNSAYVYDLLDNIKDLTNSGVTTSATYNSLNEMATFGSKSYVYGANGNTLSGDGAHTYKWDAENRLVEIDYVGSTRKSQFVYDGNGHRVIDTETAANGTVTTARYVWCGDRVCQTRNSSDIVLRRDLEEGEYNASTHQEFIYMADQLGSVRDVLDATTGARVQSYDFGPYGAVTSGNGNTLTDYHYAGLFYHPESGLNLAEYRVLDGGIGRFLTRDPMGERGGINLYSYTRSSPISKLDPRGLWQFTLTLAEGLGFQFTIGYNSGQWNAGAYAGLGAGGSWSWDPRDSGCAKTGLEVSDRISVSEDIFPGYAIDLSGEAFWNGTQEVEGDIDTPYGTYGISLQSPGDSSASTVKFPISAGHGWGIGTFAGVGGTITW